MCSNNRLQRLLLERAGDTATIQSSTVAEWSSTTFSGHRHQITMSFTDRMEADRFAEFVSDAEETLELPGALLAELIILESDEIPPLGHVFITIEALTLNND